MQNLVKDFNDKKSCHKDPMPVYARLMDIESEIGELEKEYLKSSNYGTKDFEVTDDFKEEFGDWEQYFKCKFLLEHPEVSILTGEEFAPIEGKTLTDQVEEYFIRLGGKVISPFFGEITLAQ